MTDFIFVYGTLMSFFDNHYAKLLRNNSSFVGKAFMYGRLFDFGEYPVAILTKTQKEHRILGEVYKINSSFVIDELDRYEEIGNDFPEPYEYLRKKVVASIEKQTIECWFYEYNRPISGLHEIKTGNYWEYCNNK